jgi:hypothetical protein
VAKVVARLAAADPLNRAHAPLCRVWTTPNNALTDETCDCREVTRDELAG